MRSNSSDSIEGSNQQLRPSSIRTNILKALAIKLLPKLVTQVNTLRSSHPVTSSVYEKMLPPMERKMSGRKTLVLDLDETLVHSSFDEVEHVDIILPVLLLIQKSRLRWRVNNLMFM